MLDSLNTSRRRFLKGAVAASAATIARRVLRSSAQSPPSSREKLSQFRYSDVKLTGGPLKAQFDRIHAAYMALDEDRLLKVYRLRAKLPAPGPEMGGWYDPADAFAPGHSLGQYISGLARFAEATGNTATQAKVKRLVDGFTATIDPDGYSYASLRASTAFPAYTMDKHLIGLLDAAQFAGVQSALPTAQKVIQGALRYLPDCALERDEMPRQAPYDEAYTLPENLLYAYESTGDRSLLDLAKQYLFDRRYFQPLSKGINVLPGLHAYSHVNCLSSAARAYLHLGNPMHFDAIKNAWDMLEKTQAFASGGWGPNEAFVEPNKGLLGESLRTSRAHFETPCGAYAHFKLARYLLRFTAEARYGDGLERVLYNTLLGAKDPKDAYFFYYSDYHANAQKGFFPDKWPCCSGTLPEAVADYLINAYFHSEEGIYVNLFVPSEVRWNIAGAPVKLIQTTEYPESESSELRLELATPAEFTIYIRIPGWLRSAAEIAVNGKSVSVPAEPRTFAAVRRRWQANDVIQVRLPFSFRMEPIDEQHTDTVALMRGPLMLVALSPELKLPKTVVSSPEMLKPSPYAKQSYELGEPPQKLRFMPFYTIKDEAYTNYIIRV
jgi:hypothetical protein